MKRRANALVQRAPDGRGRWYVQPVGEEPNDGDPSIPDLLHEAPIRWGDLGGVSQLVRFAFEGGDCTGALDAVVQATPLAPSSWTTAAFAPHLFFEDLVKACFTIRIEGTKIEPDRASLVRILSRPPNHAGDTSIRQAVLAELTDHSELRRDLERAYLAIRTLRALLENAPVDEADNVSRKLDVLGSVRACIDAFADGFEGAGSRLSELRAAGEAMRGRPAYARLVQLLDLDDNLATVDIRLHLGSDGHVRHMDVLSFRENTGNPLLPGPISRLGQRMASALRGYRYGEKEVVVGLLHATFAPLVDDVVTCLALTATMEFYLSALGFSDIAASKGLSVSLPTLVDAPVSANEPPIKRVLRGLFNPLLLLQGIVPQATDVAVDRHDALVVVTGPNSGGKTRLLQAVAMTQCLGQVGTFVPASRAHLARAPTLFVSLVDQADAGQVEGRLGTELGRIRKLFEELQPGTMAILDELCSGTNPAEGEAIAEMVISLLPRLRPQVFISTHFLDLAMRLERDRPVEPLAFLEVELDGSLQPTFAFIPGVAKTSLANQVAARLGVTREELEALVEAHAGRSR